MSFCTRTELKTYLGLAGASDDVLLDALVARAQKMIESTCRRTFEAGASTVHKFDAVQDVQGAVLYLDADLCAITSVTNGDGAPIAPSAYVTEPRNRTPYFALRLLDSSGLEWTYLDDPQDAIEVNGRWAYSETAPEHVQQLCIEIAAALYRLREYPAAIQGEVNGPRLLTAQDVNSYLNRRALTLGLIRVG